MYSVNFDNNIIIQSDNQYFYVTFSNYTVYIYNPSLPQHMSLYYILELTQPIICTSAIFLMQDNFNSAVLLYNNSFFKLNNFQTFNSSFDGGNPDAYYTKTYPQLIYNYSIVSGINPNSLYQTPNESVSYLSNFTTFQNQKQQQIQLTQDNLILRPINQSSEINSIAFQYPINLIIDRQASDCQCISPQYCYIDQPSRLHFSNNTDNFTLITSINNQFLALQNNETIQILNGELTILSNFSYSYLNFIECLISTSNKNNLYSICYNDTSQYWLTFTLNTSGIVSKFDLIQFNQTFSKIQKIGCLLDQIFILAMFNNKGQELYLFNSFNSSLQQLSVYKNNKSMCQDFDIGILQSNSLDFQSNTIILFMTNGFQLYYQMMFVSANAIELSSIVSYQLQICNQQFGCFLATQIIFNLLILQTEGHNVILIASNSNISFIIKIRVLIEQILGSPALASVIQTIPNYNLNNDGYIIYSDGILMQQFQYFFNEYFVGIYYLDNLAQLQDPFEPILMLGQLNTTSVQKAMIVNKTNPQNIGIILSFFNNSIYSQGLSTWNLTKIFLQVKTKLMFLSIVKIFIHLVLIIQHFICLNSLILTLEDGFIFCFQQQLYFYQYFAQEQGRIQRIQNIYQKLNYDVNMLQKYQLYYVSNQYYEYDWGGDILVFFFFWTTIYQLSHLYHQFDLKLKISFLEYPQKYNHNENVIQKQYQLNLHNNQ
ncbi:unnamed protein product (macronuclear) [Paramecium tetraurelia]|uniref:Transmembrane protein n=1 Tax=Paramecium tetraurelia TaxID=5888 RepID=A0D8D1_PARTE|nr:uncharacterized protein GSPATT00039316001 [Paramecium tetraurelia]CAK79298.1 unnamed protein product [Paramecium tetraurelia]|eukprot:XP_001446695.1 hypothetical protein (macronuclear) [Paramecium tetraurelia strain d4-2]